MPSGDYFIISSKGINVYNHNFSLIIFSYVFDNEEIINGYNEHRKSALSKYKYSDNFYIFILTKGKYILYL